MTSANFFIERVEDTRLSQKAFVKIGSDDDVCEQ